MNVGREWHDAHFDYFSLLLLLYAIFPFSFFFLLFPTVPYREKKINELTKDPSLKS